MTKKALGKGLGAFIPEEFGILKEERYAEVKKSSPTPGSQGPSLTTSQSRSWPGR